MAKWDDSVINTNIEALAFNRVLTTQSVPIMAEHSPTLAALVGRQIDEMTELGKVPAHQRLEVIEGNKAEVTFMNKYLTISNVANSAQMNADTTRSYDFDDFGGAEFDLAHVETKVSFAHTDMHKIGGDRLKGAKYLDEKRRQIQMSVNKHVNESLWVTGAEGNPDDDDIGSILYAIMGIDGAWGTNPDPYGTIDRNDSANSNLRGNYTGAIGTLGFDDINTAITTVKARGGRLAHGFSGAAVHNGIIELLQDKTVIQVPAASGDRAMFGYQNIGYAGIEFTFDVNVPSGYLTLIDPEWWTVIMSMGFSGGMLGPILPDPVVRAAHYAQLEFYFQVICKHPGAQHVLAGIS